MDQIDGKPMDLRISEMFEELSHAREEVLPSKLWTQLNNQNVQQLESDGYENFKRTITKNYFTWVIGVMSPGIKSQYTYLWQHLPSITLLSVGLRTLFMGSHAEIPWKNAVSYNLLCRLGWAYALHSDAAQRVNVLTEPVEGNPFPITYNGKLISQDLSNSFLEYRSIMDAKIKTQSIRTVMELGAGYGRTGYVFLKLKPDIRYIVVDIPPALYVAEKYLSSQFADRRIFRFRPFQDYKTIAQEFEQAQIAFLLPHQLELLPDKSIDLSINISSLHEMLPEQVAYYLNQIDRLTHGYFYMKQWKQWFNSVDQLLVKEDYYPIPQSWTRMFWRECAVQTLFFEALFAISVNHESTSPPRPTEGRHPLPTS